MVKKTIPIFVPHKGCPNDCIFCNQKKITGVLQEQTKEEIIQTIEEALETMQEDTCVEIAFFGGSFTAIEMKKQTELLEIAKKYMDQNKVHAIRISTRPDAINQAILDHLKEYGVSIIELGVQSMEEDVLFAANRGHDADCVQSSSSLIKANGFQLGLQMMIGLPLDTAQKIENTVQKFIQISPAMVRIYPVLVIKDTALEAMYKEGHYKPWTVEDAAEAAKNAYLQFENAGIRVIRMGLQASDTINMGADVVAGPFHPAFGEIVLSLIYRDLIEDYIQAKGKQQAKELVLEVPKQDISKAIGNNKSNKNYFKSKYGINLKIIGANDEKHSQISFSAHKETQNPTQGAK